VRVGVKTPQQCAPGCDFNDAIEAKSNKRDTSGEESGDKSNHTFETVVAYREPFKPDTTCNLLSSDLGFGRQHTHKSSARHL
jgi:hypothetical protein